MVDNYLPLALICRPVVCLPLPLRKCDPIWIQLTRYDPKRFFFLSLAFYLRISNKRTDWSNTDHTQNKSPQSLQLLFIRSIIRKVTPKTFSDYSKKAFRCTCCDFCMWERERERERERAVSIGDCERVCNRNRSTVGVIKRSSSTFN